MSRPDMTNWNLAHRLKLDEPTVLLNKWQRMHWQAKRRYQTRLMWLIAAARNPAPAEPIEQSRVHVIRANPKPFPDPDGLIGGLKPLLDCLVALKYLTDDNPRVVQSLTAESILAPKNKGFTEVEIWVPA